MLSAAGLGRRSPADQARDRYHSRMIEIIIPPEKPESEVRRWYPILRFLKRVAAAEKIEVRTVALHAHAPGTVSCYDGETDFDEKRIDLCSGQDKETVLHELAHLESDDYHGKRWSMSLMHLHQKYLPKARCEHADRVLAIEYRAARPLFRERYGVSAPRERRGMRSVFRPQRKD